MESTWGVSRTIALALASLGLDVIHRSTLRALLPAGRVVHAGRRAGKSSGSVNATTKRFQDALARFERNGWIVRGTEYVRIIDRGSLHDFVLLAPVPEAESLLALREGIDQIRLDLRNVHQSNPRAIEQRQRELLAIKRLMESGMGANWSGRGSVRFVSRGSVL